MQQLKRYFFKYCVYYFVVLIRREWIWEISKNLKNSEKNDIYFLKNLQLKKFNKILSKAKHSKYYRCRNIPEKINSLDDIKNLPFLLKEDLRNNENEIKTGRDPLFFTTKTSGGSTGAPITIKKPANAMAHELAAAWRGYSWAGIYIGDLQARFWGTPITKSMALKAKIIDFVTRRIRFSAFRFSKNDLALYVKNLENKNPDYFYGYVSMIKELSIYLKEIDPENKIQPKAIITTSEVLSKEDRDAIEQAFDCKVYNEYGCGEVGTIAHECEQGQMHINMENVIIEIIDKDGNVLPDNSEGEIVVTDLNNTLMPIIRYKICDYGSLSSDTCQCGRQLKILNKIKGRAYDFIENEKGEKFHGEFFLYIVEEMKSNGIKIEGIQFILENKKIQVKIVSSENEYFKAENYIKNRINDLFSKNIILLFYKVEEIKREKSGKLRVVKRIN